MRRPAVAAIAAVAALVGAVRPAAVTWAALAQTASAGPETVITASLNPGPTTPSALNGGCAGTNHQTNVTTSWTDSQSGTQDAAGGPLVSGYTIGRAAASAGPYATAGSLTGNPPATTFTDTPAIANTPVALIVNGTNAGSKRVYPVTESSLTAGGGITIGTAGSEVNAIQISPDGLTAVIAEYTAAQVQILTWSSGAWGLVKTLAVTSPTALAISPVANSSGSYVAYIVSDPGPNANGSVYPLTLNGASSTLGSAITVQHQANPTAVAVTPNGGWVYVANYNSSTVSAVNTATATVTTITLSGTAPRPVALATTFDSSHIYAADRANSLIDDITVASNTVTATVSLSSGALNDTILTGAGNPNVLAMTPNGKSLYVAEFGTNSVQVVNSALAASPDTIAATISTGAGSQPIDLAMTPNGCVVYVADWPSNNVFSIATATNAEATVFTTSCWTQDPQGMQVTPDNQYLFIPENYSCGDLDILNTATNAVTTLTTVGAYPTMVAVPPVPVWYEITATHAQWTSNPSTASSYVVGWNPGGWQ
jgi:YVTN family beta-propeller protein